MFHGEHLMQPSSLQGHTHTENEGLLFVSQRPTKNLQRLLHKSLFTEDILEE